MDFAYICKSKKEVFCFHQQRTSFFIYSHKYAHSFYCCIPFQARTLLLYSLSGTPLLVHHLICNINLHKCILLIRGQSQRLTEQKLHISCVF